MQVHLENRRRELSYQGLDQYEAFKLAKANDESKISVDRHTIKTFLERNGEPRPISKHTLDSIIRRYDRDGDGRISL
jgi:Ca2+-binding EF-hand superfamily protein